MAAWKGIKKRDELIFHFKWSYLRAIIKMMYAVSYFFVTAAADHFCISKAHAIGTFNNARTFL